MVPFESGQVKTRMCDILSPMLRPKGVVAIAVLLILLAAWSSSVVFLGLLKHKPVELWPVVLLLQGVLNVVTAIGLLQMKKWAWFLFAYRVLQTLLHAEAMQGVDWMVFALLLISAWYLWKNRQLFGIQGIAQNT